MTLTTEQAIEELNGLAHWIDEFGEVPATEEAVYMAIEALEKRKTGKWEKDENGTDHCSCCDYIPAYDTAIDDIFCSPYCPNCGAKMAAADEEEDG